MGRRWRERGGSGVSAHRLGDKQLASLFGGDVVEHLGEGEREREREREDEGPRERKGEGEGEGEGEGLPKEPRPRLKMWSFHSPAWGWGLMVEGGRTVLRGRTREGRDEREWTRPLAPWRTPRSRERRQIWTIGRARASRRRSGPRGPSGAH